MNSSHPEHRKHPNGEQLSSIKTRNIQLTSLTKGTRFQPSDSLYSPYNRILRKSRDQLAIPFLKILGAEAGQAQQSWNSEIKASTRQSWGPNGLSSKREKEVVTKRLRINPTGSKGWNPEKIPRKILEQDVIVGVARVVVGAESNIARQGDARLF